MRVKCCIAFFGLSALGVFSAGGPAQAKDLFDVNVSVTTPTVASGSASLNTISDLANALNNNGLQALVPAYLPNSSAASATLNILGVSATASYPNNSTALRFQVPAAGLDVTFTGVDRNDSQTQLKNFLLKDRSSLLTSLLQALIAGSPVNPVAGNPNSLQNTMAAADFNIATGIGLGGLDLPSSSGPNGQLVQPNLISAGGDIGIANSGGYTSTIVTVPIRYTIPFSDPRFALTFDLPLTYVSTQGATSAYGSFGVALRIPVPAIANWYLTPSLRAGASGSLDLGAGALEYSGGLTSRYDVFVKDLDITIGNGITVAKTAPLDIGSVNINYNLTNEYFTNALQVEGSLPYTLFGNPTSWQTYVADTEITGSRVYVSHYDEVGFTVGSRHGLNSQDWQSLRAGFGVTVGTHYNAYKLGFTYRF